MSNEMICTVCRQPKHKLKETTSKIFPAMALYLCSDCEVNGFEPRAAIILAARADGAHAVAEYLRHHKYYGDAILAKELAL